MTQPVPEAGRPTRRRSKASPYRSENPLWHFFFLALAIKAAVLFVDPNPEFFLGDSASYLHSALTGWIPPDRSYVYGFLIHWLTLVSGSLFSLVLAQVLASAICAGLLGWFLLRFIHATSRVATGAVVFYALDPLQLLYERFVMAEAFSLLAALVFVALVLVYLDQGKSRHLVLASLAGIAAVALRVSYLPPILALSFSAPFIRFASVWLEEGRDLKTSCKALLIGLGVITIAHLALHTSYKTLTGALTKQPPAYQYADGLFLLSAWSPLLTPEDFKVAHASISIIKGTAVRSAENRRVQRWRPDGIVAALETQSGDAVKANSLAKKISLHILKRDPIGIASLALHTYVQGWQTGVIAKCIAEDLGNRVIPPDLVKRAAEQFHVAAEDMQNRNTVTKAWFRHGTQWYRLLLATPLLLLVALPLAERTTRRFLIAVSLFAGVVLLTANALAVDNSIRYLHPLGWTFFFLAGFWAHFFEKRLRAH